MAKGLGYGTKIASKQTKDGGFKGVTPRKEVGGPYNNPSKAQAKGTEHKVGKLGK